MSTEDKNIFDNTREMLDSLIKGRQEDQSLIATAIDTIKMLRTAIPNVICEAGRAVCKTAETILPEEKVVLIKYSPISRKCSLSLFGMGPAPTMKEVEMYFNYAHEIAKRMADEEGRIRSKHEKAIN